MSAVQERVRVELDGGVATATLARPDKHNALDPAMFEGLVAAAEDLRERAEVRAVVLHGEGPSFCSGLDFGAAAAEQRDPDALLAARDERGANLAQRAALDWVHLPVPVIAALHGHVLGGGFQIALGADVRIAAPDVRMSVMEIVHGLIPDMGASLTFPRVMRADVARELTWSGRKVEADEALRLGLVTRIAEDPLAEALEVAGAIAERSPAAIRSAKRLLDAAWENPAGAELLRLETELQKQLLERAADS